MDIQLTLDFLADLEQHNHKEWMDDNKKRYLLAKEQVIELIAEVIKKSMVFDPSLSGVDPKKTLFRINRDIRFSNNKDPYKTNFGAALVEGGRKSGKPGYYIHIKPGQNFAGGGLYQPSPEALGKIRQEIDYNGKEIRAIIDSEKFTKIYTKPYEEEKLKTAPKGYPKDHENIDLLQLKHYVYMRDISNEEITSKDAVELIVNSFQALYPYNQFLLRSLD